MAYIIVTSSEIGNPKPASINDMKYAAGGKAGRDYARRRKRERVCVRGGGTRQAESEQEEEEARHHQHTLHNQ